MASYAQAGPTPARGVSAGTEGALKSISTLERIARVLYEGGWNLYWIPSQSACAFSSNTAQFELKNRATYLYVVRLRIEARARGQGYGTQVLQELCAAADHVRAELRLYAYPLTDRTTITNPYDLAAWYARAGGFEPLYYNMLGKGIRMRRG